MVNGQRGLLVCVYPLWRNSWFDNLARAAGVLWASVLPRRESDEITFWPLMLFTLLTTLHLLPLPKTSRLRPLTWQQGQRH